MSPRTSKSDEKRRAIRSAAYRCFRDHGYHETSVDMICEAAEISKGSLYWHYDSKQGVFVDIIETWAREIMDELYEQFEAAPTQSDVLTAATLAVQREFHRGRAIVPLWLEFTALARREPEIQIALAKFYRRARTAIGEMLRVVVGEDATARETRGFASVIFGAYTGLMMQELADPGKADAHEFIADAMSIIRRLVGSPVPAATTSEVPAPKRLSEREFEMFTHGLSSRVRGRLATLREIIGTIAPLAHERVINGWNQIAYDQDGIFCYLRPARDSVVVGFNKGIQLSDPGKLLEGGGKRTRLLSLDDSAPLPEAPIRAFVKAARDLQRSS